MQILTWRTEALTSLIDKKFPCIEGFFKAWVDFKTSYHFRPAKTHNNLLHSPIFFNQQILRNPTPCCHSFEDKLYNFVTRRLRECARDVEEGYDKVMHPEACSSKRKGLVQCAVPALDLKGSFPEFNSKDFHEHKVFRMMKYLMNWCHLRSGIVAPYA